ncbi:hypothetical protein KY320_00575 [Candidatus Woesearchaeota archaeon]|nr:hypothetical protein [Candidatus Woesearchaeota archaeon]
MIKKIFLFPFLITLLILYIKHVSSCSLSGPYIQLNEGYKKCKIYPDSWLDNFNITSVNRTNLDIVCPDFALTDADKNIIIDFVDQQREFPDNFEERKKIYRYDSYTHMEKQTIEEYAEFQKKMNKINSAICDCTEYIFLERRSDWTIYNADSKDTCSFSTACYQPPFYCPNSLYFTLIIYFVSSVLIIAGIAAGLIVFIRKRSKIVS